MLNEYGIDTFTAGRAIISLKLRRGDLLDRLAIETEHEEIKSLKSWVAKIEALTAHLSGEYLNQ